VRAFGYKGRAMAKELACSTVLFSLSALASLLFAYTTVKLVQHTPVYRPLECTTNAHDLGDQEMDGFWVNISGTAVKSCRNPNSFNMRLYQGEPSKVYLRDGLVLEPVGESFVTDSTFAAKGEGTGGLMLKIALPFLEAMDLLSKEKVQVVTEINAQAEAEMFFLGVGVKVAEKSSKVCGFELALFPEQKVGYSACADSLEDLVIPDVNATTEVADLITMSPELYEYETQRKNVAFGGLMAVSALLAMSLLACGVRAQRRPGGAKEAREAKIEAPVAAPVAETGSQQGQDKAEAETCASV